MLIKLRFAPSPTGFLHIGGFRTALYNYIYAKKNNGKIILRIEDTDQNRKIDNATENLINSFKYFNIDFNEGPGMGGNFGPYFQSKRLTLYHSHIRILLESELAYPCFCSGERLEKLRNKLLLEKKTIKYDRYCLNIDKEKRTQRMKSEKHVVRMKVPDKEEIIFYDAVRDKVAIKSEEIDDQVLIKSDGYPTYHFANVIDDHLMKITHVMRGEEWLPSTPKHILLYEMFEWEAPKFIHLPLLLNNDKSKLSKRQGDVAVEDYIKKGYLPQAIINFVALLGWHPNSNDEIFTIDQLEKEFSLNRIQKSGAVFDIEKLKWMNSQYLKKLPLNEIVKKVKPFFNESKYDISDDHKFNQVIDIVRKRVNTLAQIPHECKMFYEKIIISDENLQIIKTKQAYSILSKLYNTLELDENICGTQFKQIIMDIGDSLNIKGKDLFFPIRIVLCSETKGPDIPIIFSILGRKEVLERIKRNI